MWDSALRGLGSGLRSSSSESLLGDVSSPGERLQETGTQEPQASRPPPAALSSLGTFFFFFLQHVFIPVLDLEYIKNI